MPPSEIDESTNTIVTRIQKRLNRSLDVHSVKVMPNPSKSLEPVVKSEPGTLVKVVIGHPLFDETWGTLSREDAEAALCTHVQDQIDSFDGTIVRTEILPSQAPTEPCSFYIQLFPNE